MREFLIGAGRDHVGALLKEPMFRRMWPVHQRGSLGCRETRRKFILRCVFFDAQKNVAMECAGALECAGTTALWDCETCLAGESGDMSPHYKFPGGAAVNQLGMTNIGVLKHF